MNLSLPISLNKTRTHKKNRKRNKTLLHPPLPRVNHPTVIYGQYLVVATK